MFSGNCFEIEYTKKFPFVKISKNNLFAIFFIAALIGFGAWFLETILDYVAMGYLFDRGFLVGPFIPIYFFSIILGLCYIKTPKASVKNFFLYILIIGVGISTIEFIVGNLAEIIIGDVLWTYDNFMPLSYKYVSVTVGLIWGVLGTLLFMFIFPLIKKIPDKITNKGKIIFTVLFWVYFISDLLVTCILIINNGGVYKDLYCIKASVELTLFMIGIILYILIVVFFGIFLSKRFLKFKAFSVIIYILSVIIPVFSCIDFLDRFNNKFLIFLASLGFIILAVYIYMLLALLVISLIVFILRKTTKKEIFRQKKVESICIYISICVGILVTLIGVLCVNNPKIKHLDIGTGNNELNIVAVSDIHYGSTGTNVDLAKMVDQINSQNPDVVFILGDTIDNYIDKIDQEYFLDNMRKIEAKYGVYAIGGNHEYEYGSSRDIFNLIRAANINVLLDSTILINNEVLVVGRYDFIFKNRKSLADIVGVNTNYPIIVLDHQPYDSDEARDFGVSLQLSGHTHNGQLFPANFIVWAYQSIRYKCDKVNGLYQEDDYSIYVTCGYGTWGFPLRTTGSSEILQINYYY